MRIATLTLRAIEDQLYSDQGALFRQYEQQLLPTMSDAYSAKNDPFRSHFGASIAGHECGRSLYYSWRWATREKFKGSVIRLFNRGHLEEGRFLALLKAIRVHVVQQDENGNQFRINDSKGHFGGSTDGLAFGIPDCPNQWCVLEFKTHNDSSFKSLEKKGVEESKFVHYVQTQIYMRKLGIPIALYMATNKNNDTLYAEIIELKCEIADKMIERADRVIWMKEVPKKINESAGFFICKSRCNHYAVCHLKKPADINCRTCRHSYPQNNALWLCEKYNTYIDTQFQFSGCRDYSCRF